MLFEFKRNSTEDKSSTLFSVCDHCGNYGKYRNAKGVDYNWQDDALMLHEAQHSIDWCADITNSTKKETRAYYLYNLTQGKATYNDFVQELKSAVNRSTQNFEEEVFIETLKELQTNN